MIGDTRLYADETGETHLDDVVIEGRPLDLVAGVPPATLAGPLPGGDLYLVRIPAEQREDGWHPAPQRQWVVHLVGTTEVETSDGTVRQFGPGTLLPAEDTIGKGHNSRTVNDGGQLMLVIPLPADST